MTTKEICDKQQEIIAALKVRPTIFPTSQIERRSIFLYQYARAAGANGFILGISGGQDSFVAGMLGKMAAKRMGRKFVAMRLPYGTQKDEADAQAAINVIQPDEVITYNIKSEVDAMSIEYWNATRKSLSDFLRGNDKARARMLAQYRVAADQGLLVIGTDHAAEAVTGFYTKWGDGACDIAPLSSLNKRQGRLLAKILGAPENIITKKPTADLLDNIPQQADETELGLTYDQIDDFLEGKYIELDTAVKLINCYTRTQHKRKSIPSF